MRKPTNKERKQSPRAATPRSIYRRTLPFSKSALLQVHNAKLKTEAQKHGQSHQGIPDPTSPSDKFFKLTSKLPLPGTPRSQTFLFPFLFFFTL
jgi:hypothetical protein